MEAKKSELALFNRISTEYLLISGVLVLGLLLVLLPQGPFYTTETTRIPVSAQVLPPTNSDLGVSNENTTLDFGRLKQGLEARKFVSVQHTGKPSKVSLSASGNASQFVTFPVESKVIQSSEAQTFETVFRAEQTGVYTGTVYITKATPKFSALNPFLSLLP